MAGEPDAGAGGGNDPAGGQGSGEGSSPEPDQKAGAGAGGAGSPQSPEGGVGKQVAGIDPSILPPELQGRSEAELKFILPNLVSSVKKQADELKRLKASAGAGEDKEPEKKEPKKPLEERILEDPEGAVAEIVEKRYGGVIQRLGQRTERSELAMAKSQLDDFEEYEEEVVAILNEAGEEKTFENLAGAYVMAVGQKTLQQKRQQRQQSEGLESGGPRPNDDEGKRPKLSDLEREVAAAHGMSEKEWVEARDTDPTSLIKVPTGQREEK